MDINMIHGAVHFFGQNLVTFLLVSPQLIRHELVRRTWYRTGRTKEEKQDEKGRYLGNDKMSLQKTT